MIIRTIICMSYTFHYLAHLYITLRAHSYDMTHLRDIISNHSLHSVVLCLPPCAIVDCSQAFHSQSFTAIQIYFSITPKFEMNNFFNSRFFFSLQWLLESRKINKKKFPSESSFRSCFKFINAKKYKGRLSKKKAIEISRKYFQK